VRIAEIDQMEVD